MLRAWPGSSEAWDLPGFGTAEDSRVSVNTWLRQSVARLPPNCVLVGWSLGGMLASALAALAPEKVRGLVTVSTNASFVQTPSWRFAMSGETFAEFCRAFRADADKTFKRFCALQSQGDSEQRAVRSALAQYAPAAHQKDLWAESLDWLGELNHEALLVDPPLPSLHIFGDGDALVPVAAAEQYPAHPKTHVAVIAQAGHCLPISRPEILAAKIGAFVDGLVPIAKARIASSFTRAARAYDQAAFIQKTVARNLLGNVRHRLEGVWLDLGCGTGNLQNQMPMQLQPHFWLNGDLAEGMLAEVKRKRPRAHLVCLDAESLPIAQQSLDGVMSSLTLQWCQQPEVAFAEIFQALRPGGRFVAATLVEGTLGELKSAWRQVDDYVHVNRFVDGETLRRALLGVGFELDTFELKIEVDWQPDFVAILKNLKAIGAHNMNQGRKPGMSTRKSLVILERAYRQFQAEDGRWPATYSVVYLQAKKP